MVVDVDRTGPGRLRGGRGPAWPDRDHRRPLAAMVAFAGHRVTAPADGTAIEVSAARGSAGAAVQVDRPGAGPIEAGDRIVAVLGRDLDTGQACCSTLRGPAGRRRQDPMALVVVRDGTTAPLTRSRSHSTRSARSRRAGACSCSAWPWRPAACTPSSVDPTSPPPGWCSSGHGPAGERGRPDARPPGARLRHRTGFWLYAATAGLAYALFLGGVLGSRSSSRGLIRSPPAAIGWRGVARPGAGAAGSCGWCRPDDRTNAGGDRRLACRVGCPVDRRPRRGRGLLAASYRRLVDPVSRLQLRWLAAAVVLVVVGAVALWFGPLLLFGEPLVPRSAMPLLCCRSPLPWR